MEAPRLIETVLLCQNGECHDVLAVGAMPWTTGRIDIMCRKCQRMSRFNMTPEGILAQVVPAPARFTKR